MSRFRDGLLHNTLPFWLKHAVDLECGGFLTALDRDGSVIDTDKGVWQQCRFTWLLGELYNEVEPRPDWLDLCRHGIEFIDRHCFDPADGRMWFHVTREGQPIRKRRYAFSECFAAIAYGELAKATGQERWAEQARTLFQSFIDHHTIPGRAPKKFTDTRPCKSMGLPMMTIVTAQQLRDSAALPAADRWIDLAIEEIRRDFLKPDLRCVMETVGPQGEIYDHFDGRTLNPGHAIEAAWFIMLEGKRRRDRTLICTGCEMLDWMWERGWDQQYGGMLYFCDVYGKPVQEYWHDMKFWWPHNETILATLLAHLLTGEEQYARWHEAVTDWAYSRFPDHQYGEWFGYLHRDGRLSVPLKGNLWKGPFHLPRMQLLGWKWLAEHEAEQQGGQE